MKKILILISVTTIFISACSKSGGGSNNNPNTCDNVAKSYMTNVSPIIQSSCAINAGCHGSGSTNGPGPLLNHTQVFNARTNIRTAVANGTMPQNSTLSTSQKNTIICWIDSGAPNN